MANWCVNTITLSGHACWLVAHEWVPKAFPIDFEILDRDLFKVKFRCRTKWDPKLEIFQELCKKHNVSAIVSYDEFLTALKGKVYISVEGEIINIMEESQ
jgi:hypothetical protein